MSEKYGQCYTEGNPWQVRSRKAKEQITGKESSNKQFGLVSQQGLDDFSSSVTINSILHAEILPKSWKYSSSEFSLNMENISQESKHRPIIRSIQKFLLEAQMTRFELCSCLERALVLEKRWKERERRWSTASWMNSRVPLEELKDYVTDHHGSSWDRSSWRKSSYVGWLGVKKNMMACDQSINGKHSSDSLGEIIHWKCMWLFTSTL